MIWIFKTDTDHPERHGVPPYNSVFISLAIGPPRLRDLEGIILCATSIVFQAGSSLIGAALAQTAVTLDAATIVKPSAALGAGPPG